NDESGAPSFVDRLARASSRHERGVRLRLDWQVVVAIVVALLLGGAWLIFSGRGKKPPGRADLVYSRVPPAPRVEAAPPNPKPPLLGEQTFKPDRHYRKQRRVRLRPETLLLSQWRSPTESLMRAPGEQLLKTIPRLNESLIDIKAIEPTQQKDQRN